MRLLITGATGKLGQNFLPAFLDMPQFQDWHVTVLCNNRKPAPNPRITIINGSLSDIEAVTLAMNDVTHVLHLAAVKETPSQVFDVALKGMYHLLEAARTSDCFQQFIHLSGDCVIGHIFQDYSGPITEASARRGYPGCYALTKALEEEMLEQYQHQYGLNGCILRVPWIMEKDDFKFAMSFGDDQFGGPPWSDLMSDEALDGCRATPSIPLLYAADGQPLLRNFIHVSDVCSGILSSLANARAEQQLFHLAMANPINYADLSALANVQFGLKPVKITTPFFSNHISIEKAGAQIGWQPQYDMQRMAVEAWAYERKPNEIRTIHYPG